MGKVLSLAEKGLPSSVESERAVLLAAMLEPRRLHLVCDELAPQDFTLRQHAVIFEAIRALRDGGHEVDELEVLRELTRRNELENVGGSAYVAGLNLERYSIGEGSVRRYVETLREATSRRMMLELADALKAHAADTGIPASNVLYDAMRRLEGIDSGADPEALFAPFSKAVAEAEAALSVPFGQTLGIATGLRPIDETTNGMRRSELFCLAGRPGQGKSALAHQIALHAAQHGERVSIVSLEMGRLEIVQRMLANVSGVDHDRIQRRSLDAMTRAQLKQHYDAMRGLPISLYRSTAAKPSDLFRLVGASNRRAPLGLLVVDYVQLMTSDRHHERRDLEVAECSRMLKRAAMEYGIAVLMLSQLSRRCEEREGAPLLSDLRESGSLEQDSDVVAFLHDGQITFRKNRNGDCGSFPLAFEGKYLRFRDLDRHHQP